MKRAYCVSLCYDKPICQGRKQQLTHDHLRAQYLGLIILGEQPILNLLYSQCRCIMCKAQYVNINIKRRPHDSCFVKRTPFNALNLQRLITKGHRKISRV